MTISQQEFETILGDDSKTIEGDITWAEDTDHSPAQEFKADVTSEAGYPLFIVGRYSGLAGTLSYVLIYRGVGRIYALDLGAVHRNPDGTLVGTKHKHRWKEGFRDKHAYMPEDITEPWDNPVEVWNQFCRQANIQHRGRMHSPVGQRRQLP